jgi:hypothetical protein
MSEHPILFGFGVPNKEDVKNYPLEFLSHHLIGGNPEDKEHGFSDTREQAIEIFALQFMELSQTAKHSFLFVRREAELTQVNGVYGGVKWRMVGRFSIAKLKEKNNG